MVLLSTGFLLSLFHHKWAGIGHRLVFADEVLIVYPHFVLITLHYPQNERRIVLCIAGTDNTKRQIENSDSQVQ